MDLWSLHKSHGEELLLTVNPLRPWITAPNCTYCKLPQRLTIDKDNPSAFDVTSAIIGIGEVNPLVDKVRVNVVDAATDLQVGPKFHVAREWASCVHSTRLVYNHKH
jgi:hypothetical protein